MSPLAKAWVLCAAMLLTACAAIVMRPVPMTAGIDLQALVPREFGDWEEERSGIAQMSVSLTDPNDPTAGDRPAYEQILTRTYRNSNGARVMLALAYGRRQMQELKIHRPELCYFAQGFAVRPLGTSSIDLQGGKVVAASALFAENRDRREPVSYWIRIGDQISTSSWQTRWIIFSAGMRGSVPDGMLVRASSLVERDTDVQPAFVVQHEFLQQLFAHMSAQGRRVLVGS